MIKVPQRKPHKAMSGNELLKKVVDTQQKKGTELGEAMRRVARDESKQKN